MGGGGKGGDGGAAQARQDEQERQAKIRAGTTRINQIFDGTMIGDGKLDTAASYDPTATYYNADGSVWKPSAAAVAASAMPKSTGTAPSAAPSMADATPFVAPMGAKTTTPANFSPEEIARARSTSHSLKNGALYINGVAANSHDVGNAPANGGAGAGGTTAEQEYAAALGKGLYSGIKSTGGFNDDYFHKQRQNFIDYATPQLDDQYSDANKQLTFALARSGLTDSSVRGEKASGLQKLYDLNKQKVADDALGYETSARNSVEDARAGLINTLNATGDAEGAANSALARAQALSQPAAYSPLSQLFADFTSGLGTQAAAEKSYAAGGAAPTYTTGLFGTSKNAVKVG